MFLLGLLLLAFIIFVFASSFFTGGRDYRLYWNKGLVPPQLSYNAENLTLIYISIPGLLVGKHPVEVHRKLNFLYKFIIQNTGRIHE